MRPPDQHDDGALFECTECGNRTHKPTGRTCDECEEPLRNLSKPRDL